MKITFNQAKNFILDADIVTVLDNDNQRAQVSICESDEEIIVSWTDDSGEYSFHCDCFLNTEIDKTNHVITLQSDEGGDIALFLYHLQPLP